MEYFLRQEIKNPRGQKEKTGGKRVGKTLKKLSRDVEKQHALWITKVIMVTTLGLGYMSVARATNRYVVGRGTWQETKTIRVGAWSRNHPSQLILWIERPDPAIILLCEAKCMQTAVTSRYNELTHFSIYHQISNRKGRFPLSNEKREPTGMSACITEN